MRRALVVASSKMNTTIVAGDTLASRPSSPTVISRLMDVPDSGPVPQFRFRPLTDPAAATPYAAGAMPPVPERGRRLVPSGGGGGSFGPSQVDTPRMPGKSPRSRPPCPQQRRGSKPCSRCSAGTSLPSRDARLHPAEGTQHSEARPVPTRQNSRFWMSATSRTVIVGGIPNGGYRAMAVTSDHHAARLAFQSARDADRLIGAPGGYIGCLPGWRAGQPVMAHPGAGRGSGTWPETNMGRAVWRRRGCVRWSGRRAGSARAGSGARCLVERDGDRAGHGTVDGKEVTVVGDQVGRRLDSRLLLTMVGTRP